VHKVSVAKDLLRDAVPSPGLFPTYHVPSARAAAELKYAHFLTARKDAAE
jgi:acyl-CoA dehydrogenase